MQEEVRRAEEKEAKREEKRRKAEQAKVLGEMRKRFLERISKKSVHSGVVTMRELYGEKWMTRLESRSHGVSDGGVGRILEAFVEHMRADQECGLTVKLRSQRLWWEVSEVRAAQPETSKARKRVWLVTKAQNVLW